MRWLCRLITPPGGIVLDPFAGSGSTGVAALAEGMRFVGIEREPAYAAIGRTRCANAAAALPVPPPCPAEPRKRPPRTDTPTSANRQPVRQLRLGVIDP